MTKETSDGAAEQAMEGENSAFSLFNGRCACAPSKVMTNSQICSLQPLLYKACTAMSAHCCVAGHHPPHRQRPHGILQQESGPRNYLAAAGEAVAVNAGQPWNVVAGLASDAGTYVLDRLRSFRSDDGPDAESPSASRCAHCVCNNQSNLSLINLKLFKVPWLAIGTARFLVQVRVVHGSHSRFTVGLLVQASGRASISGWPLSELAGQAPQEGTHLAHPEVS